MQESPEFGTLSFLCLFFFCLFMRDNVVHNENGIKCAKGNHCSCESEEPNEAAPLKNEVAPVQSNWGEEGGDGVNDNESDGGRAGGLAMRHVPSIAEHRVVEHRVKANYGSRDGGEGKKPSGEVVGGGEEVEQEVTERLQSCANKVAKHEPLPALKI